MQSPNLHIRELIIYTEPKFTGGGEELRKAITGKWKDRQPLHGHDDNGAPIYWLPPVRYLPGAIPKVVALASGINELEEIYAALGETIRVGSHSFTISATEMLDITVPFGLSNKLHTYETISPWIALNRKRWEEYIRAGNNDRKANILEDIFIGNLLSLSKGVGYRVEGKIQVKLHSFKERQVRFKELKLTAFLIKITANFLIPSQLGIGRHTSLGFGRFKEITF